MISNNKNTGIDKKVLLSTFWIFALLNLIFRDIHEIVKPEFLEQMLAGTGNGTQQSEVLFLLGGIMIEIPIAMVLLSRILNYRVNRWANIFAAVFTIASLFINNTAPDMDDIFFATIEFVALAFIIWNAWKWPNPEFAPNQSPQLSRN